MQHRIDRILASIDAGLQSTDYGSVGFGTDWDSAGRCWRCRANRTSEPLQTCDECREELSA